MYLLLITPCQGTTMKSALKISHLELAAGLAAIGLVFAPPVAAQEAAKTGGSTVTVTVKNVGSEGHSLMGTLCPHEDTFGRTACVGGVNATAPAKAGDTDLVFANVPNGTFGLALFHDIDGDGRLNVFAEPMAFGNNATDLPPVYASSALKIAGDLKTETTLFKMNP